MEYLAGKRIDLVISISKNSQEEELTNDYLVRRRTVDFGTPLITDVQLAQRYGRGTGAKEPRYAEPRPGNARRVGP
jgi:hypothetical protein